VRTLLPAPAHAELLSGAGNISTRNSRKMRAHCNVDFTPAISSPSRKDETILCQPMGVNKEGLMKAVLSSREDSR
tara:strand:+ start:36 stop:260 length:225 start_codon:yes stop_codon:yes gene_type:complete